MKLKAPFANIALKTLELQQLRCALVERMAAVPLYTAIKVSSLGRTALNRGNGFNTYSCDT